jgi:hypothetical protein
MHDFLHLTMSRDSRPRSKKCPSGSAISVVRRSYSKHSLHEDFFGRVLEALLGGQVAVWVCDELHLLQVLEFLLIPDVSVVRRQAHQVVNLKREHRIDIVANCVYIIQHSLSKMKLSLQTYEIKHKDENQNLI